MLQGEGEGAAPAQDGTIEVGELVGAEPPVEVAVGVPAGVLPAGEVLAAADGVGVLVGRATPADTVRVRVTVTVLVGPGTVAVGPRTVAVTVIAGRARTGRVTGSVIGWVEAAGSEWPAPPITMPASSPAAPASVTGRRHQFRGASIPNMAS